MEKRCNVNRWVFGPWKRFEIIFAFCICNTLNAHYQRLFFMLYSLQNRCRFTAGFSIRFGSRFTSRFSSRFINKSIYNSRNCCGSAHQNLTENLTEILNHWLIRFSSGLSRTCASKWLFFLLRIVWFQINEPIWPIFRCNIQLLSLLACYFHAYS